MHDTQKYTVACHQAFDSIISDAGVIADTTTDFYDYGLTIHRYALVGVACPGIVILANHGVFGVTIIIKVSLAQLRSRWEILSLTVNLIVTLSTESVGFVHGISLRSALASESRLRFNTNLRLLTAARGWYSPNGILLNGISAILLIISYSSASFVVCLESRITLQYTPSDGIAFAGLPLLVCGIALLLQVTIALLGMWAVKILTWNSSPFDLTAALVHHKQLTPTMLHCMRCVSDLDTDGGPTKAREIQPSAWHAHPSIRKVFLWVIVIACAGWAAFVMYIWDKYPSMRFQPYALTLQTWSLLPNDLSNCIRYFIPGVNLEVWMLLFVNMAAIQGPLTLGLHCSELIANVIRDERHWRCATGRKGLITATNPVKTIFIHPNLSRTFRRKACPANTGAANGKIGLPTIFMFTAQIWNLCIALFIFSYFFTFVALRRPRGPQPAAYGHVQTLANLVDEWSPVMWWGHKEDGL
ncbi:hypothetical protein BDR04DRAFT_1117330 [Suillus decipiens]|nr:hypothetical protein BDR04DRAFT_1117330 [Suillus decipiens]